jgi:hypothetical protein
MNLINRFTQQSAGRVSAQRVYESRGLGVLLPLSRRAEMVWTLRGVNLIAVGRFGRWQEVFWFCL